MNVRAVSVCVATTTKKQKTDSLLDEFPYSFNSYSCL